MLARETDWRPFFNEQALLYHILSTNGGCPPLTG